MARIDPPIDCTAMCFRGLEMNSCFSPQVCSWKVRTHSIPVVWFRAWFPSWVGIVFVLFPVSTIPPRSSFAPGAVHSCTVGGLDRKSHVTTMWSRLRLAAPSRGSLRDAGKRCSTVRNVTSGWDDESEGGVPIKRSRPGRHPSPDWNRRSGSSTNWKGKNKRYDDRDMGHRNQYRASDETPSQRNLRENIRGEALYGIAPVCAALQADRRRVHALYVQEGSDLKQKKDAAAYIAAIQSAKKLGCPIENVSKHELNLLCNYRPHQGLILDADPFEFINLSEPPPDDDSNKTPVWVVLDEVADPQNFGAIIRSAFFLGAAGIITCARNSAPLSPTVSKASAGALEWIDVHSAKNLPKFLEQCRDDGWAVVGAAAENSTAVASQMRLQQPTMLVFGNEGAGLRTNVRTRCTEIVRIGEW